MTDNTDKHLDIPDWVRDGRPKTKEESKQEIEQEAKRLSELFESIQKDVKDRLLTTAFTATSSLLIGAGVSGFFTALILSPTLQFKLYVVAGVLLIMGVILALVSYRLSKKTTTLESAVRFGFPYMFVHLNFLRKEYSEKWPEKTNGDR